MLADGKGVRQMSRQNRLALLTSGVVLLLGLGAGLSRLHWRKQLHLRPGSSVWRLRYEVEFQAGKAGAQVVAGVPEGTSSCRLFRQKLSHSGMRQVLVRNKTADSLEVICQARKPGRYRLLAEYDLHYAPAANNRHLPARTVLTTPSRAHYLREERYIQVSDPTVLRALARLSSQTGGKKDALAGAVLRHCHREIGVVHGSGGEDAATALGGGGVNALGQARAMVALCRAAKLPARLVTGFVLAPSRQTTVHNWVEVFTGQGWQSYDPLFGYAGEVPATYLPVQRNGATIAVAKEGAVGLKSAFSLSQLPPPPGLNDSATPQLRDIFDLTRLPLSLQRTLAVILLLPLGALFTCLFRNLVGLQTFGTFTPSLIALSLYHADWRIGLAVLALIFLLGLLSRAFIERLKLLMVPRLSILLTLVVLALVFGLSAMVQLGISQSAEAVVLPLVIMTMLIERFHLAEQEDGPPFAIKLFLQTLVVTYGCFLLLAWQSLGWFLLIYPEFHCLTLAAMIWVGRYAGYRLTELWRFRDLVASRQSGGPGA